MFGVFLCLYFCVWGISMFGVILCLGYPMFRVFLCLGYYCLGYSHVRGISMSVFLCIGYIHIWGTSMFWGISIFGIFLLFGVFLCLGNLYVWGISVFSVCGCSDGLYSAGLWGRMSLGGRSTYTVSRISFLSFLRFVSPSILSSPETLKYSCFVRVDSLVRVGGRRIFF